jgi:carnosine N-methyltransferase
MLAAPPFNYLDTLIRADEAIECNASLARDIVRYGLGTFHNAAGAHGGEPALPVEWAGIAKNSDVDKARSTLRQFYRDWTAEGAKEREASYSPVMRALGRETERSSDGNTRPLQVLVPGAGLGRLVFELACQGYEAEGNELSYHQIVASNYILNSCESAAQHTIYPWVHSFSNHQSRQNQLRSCKVPDVHPGTVLGEALSAGSAGSMKMVASDFLCLYGDDDHRDSYDAVASVFFLDTAPNLIRYLAVIYSCLKPGGVLINVGPLLWHFEGHAPGTHGHGQNMDDGGGDDDESGHDSTMSGISEPGSFELTDDEVMLLVERMGFVVEERETGFEAPYIHDPDGMLKMVYRASSWVARKPLAPERVG